MSKLKLKLSPAGILFLIATVVLVIALVAVIIVLSKSCKSSGSSKEAAEQVSTSPSQVPTDEPATTPTEPDPTEETGESSSPAPTEKISGLEPISTSGTGDIPIAPTPASEATATPSATDKVYTSPTKAQKNAAKDGYISKDKVNMRKGPGTKYDIVKADIPKNTPVTLYEQQGDWWFLKCGSNYGYIRKDMISIGKPSVTPATTGSTSSSFEGTIKTNSVAALRKEASTSSTCIKELKNGEKVTVYYKTKDKSGNSWYYVKYGSQKGYIYASLVSTSKKVPEK